MLRAFADDAQLQTALNDAGFELIGIGQGNLKALKGWGKLNRWPLGKLYSDFEQPSLPAFAALGANFRGKPTTCCKVAKDALKGTLHGLRVVVGGCHFELTTGVAKNNVLVQAGIVAFNDDGKVIFKQMQESIDQPLPADELRAAIAGLATTGNAI